MGSNWAAIGGGDGGRSTRWTAVENKMFEDALAVHDGDTPDRWQKVAAMIPGKTVADVIRQYNELVDDVSRIEAGFVPIPGYKCNFPSRPSPPLSGLSAFGVLNWGESGFSGGCGVGRRSRTSDQERKKGIPWTEKEHKLFLLGLKKYGKGDWRNISRNFVITRTPTQVASHAQKYFIRQLSGGKDKRRASIHDITTVNVNENQTRSPEKQKPLPPDHPSVLPHHTNSISGPQFQWNTMELGFNPTNRDFFMTPYNGINSDGSFQCVGAQNMCFQMNSAHLYPHG